MRPAESFIGQPIRSLQTMLRTIAEDDGQLPTVIPDGIYGQETINAVNAFQRKYNLPITGITDQNTWEKIVAVYEPARIRADKAEYIEIIMDPGQVFRAGDKSPYILLLQSILTQLSFDTPAIIRPDHTGILDETTAQSLAEFQRIAGLPATGELDKLSWKYLVRHFTLNAHHNTISQPNRSQL